MALGILKEFKEFAIKSNFVDVAIGIFMGAGLTPVATSLVKEVVMPSIGYFLGTVDFEQMFIVLREGKEVAGPYITLAAAKKAGALTVNYGLFINSIVSFLMISWVAFWLVKLINRIRKANEVEAPPSEPTTKQCVFCLTTIPIQATKCSACTSEVEVPMA